MLHSISLGAGVQSSTMALMFACGELTPMPDCAIFADTGAEPRAVYEWLDWLEQQLPFPVHRVIKLEGLRANIIAAVAGARFAGAPFYTEPRTEEVVRSFPCECIEDFGREWITDDYGHAVLTGDDCFKCSNRGEISFTERAREGQLRRQCTREFKVEPIRKKLRELLGLAPRARAPREVLVVQYLGISYDEVVRMKPSREYWVEHRWPLVDLKMQRADCLDWMERHGYPRPPRSACTFCPYHSDEEWRALRQAPEDWASAVEIDTLIRGGVRGTKEKLYLHRSLVPLTEVDLTGAEKSGQQSLFGDECEGMCGV